MPNYVSVNHKPYLVYMNKSYDVWIRDAHHWAVLNGYDPEKDFRNTISEVVFRAYLDKGILENWPIIFVTIIYPELR